MTTKAWLMIATIVQGMSLILFATQWYMKGVLGPTGWIAFALLLTGFLLTAFALLKASLR
jgi:hypothetical protein